MVRAIAGKIGGDVRPHPGPLLRGEGESLPVSLRIRATGLAESSISKAAADSGRSLSWGRDSTTREKPWFVPLNWDGAPSTVSASPDSVVPTSRDGARRSGSWVGLG